MSGLIEVEGSRNWPSRCKTSYSEEIQMIQQGTHDVVQGHLYAIYIQVIHTNLPMVDKILLSILLHCMDGTTSWDIIEMLWKATMLGVCLFFSFWHKWNVKGFVSNNRPLRNQWQYTSDSILGQQN